MRKILTTVVVLFLTFGLFTPVKAAEMPGFLGENHFYSVTFRGNGEAIVTLKAVLTNSSDNSLNKISLRVPRVNPTELIAYQVIGDQQCLRYLQPELKSTYTLPKCLEWQEPDLSNWWGSVKYQKAKIEYSGDTIDIILPQGIKANGSGSYLLYFRAFGYAKKDLLGAFPYTFETLKANNKINKLQVGISTDADLYLRGAKGKVEYRFEAPMMAMKSAGIEAVANTQMDSVYQQIGQGTVIKNVSNLQALESYKVTGTYADSAWKAYGKELGIVAVMVLGFILLIAKLVRKTTIKIEMPPTVIVLGTSFAASLLVAGWTGGIWFVSQMANSWVILMGEVILSVVIYAVFIILPAILIGAKKGWAWGLATAGMTVGWLVLYFVSFILVMFLSSQRPYYPPMMNFQNLQNLQNSQESQIAPVLK